MFSSFVSTGYRRNFSPPRQSLPVYRRMNGRQRTALGLALVAFFSPARSSAQTSQKPDKYALTGQEQMLAEATCISKKYAPNGELVWLDCLDYVKNDMTSAKQLRYFEGTWRLTGETRPGPWGPAGRFIRTEQNEWVEKDWSLVSHWEEQQPGGVATGTTTFGHDQKHKLYTFRETDRSGAHEGTGKFDKGTWVWIGSTRLANGKPAKSRWTVYRISATSYSFELEIASPGGTWTEVLKGSATNLK